MLPNDPYMLLSYINTNLRDNYATLADLATEKDVDLNEIETKLASINYKYDEKLNKFVAK